MFAHKSLHVGKNNATMPKEPKGHEQGKKYDIVFVDFLKLTIKTHLMRKLHLCAQNIVTILGSIINTIGKVYVITERETLSLL